MRVELNCKFPELKAAFLWLSRLRYKLILLPINIFPNRHSSNNKYSNATVKFNKPVLLLRHLQD